MADEEAKKDGAEAAGGEAEAKPKRSKLPLILAVVVLLAGGGGAVWYLGLLGGGGEEGHAGHADAAALDPTKHMADPNALGAMLALDPFIANLSDAGGARYLKTTFQLEFESDAIPHEAEERIPQIRDLLLTLLTSKSFEEIRTPAGKQNLREDVINRVNQVLDGPTVRAVYFTEFIVQ
jgi:flagellar FliL protein